MEKILSVEEKKIFQGTTPPAVSILLPFEPKMSIKHELEYKLKIATGKVEKELVQNYPHEKAAVVVTKLQRIIDHLDFNTHKKSIAIFVSSEIEKIFYLDIVVKEKIVIDGYFEIRDLIANKKQNRQYLILHLTGKHSKIYLADDSKIDVIRSNMASNIKAYERDMPERVPHFDDPEKYKEILLEKFLHHMDKGLTMIVEAFPFPVFVIASERVLGHFKKITKNQQAIVAFVHGGYEDLRETEIVKIIAPYVADWNRVKQMTLLKQIEKAEDNHKLVYGIREVLNVTLHKNSRLLIIEKDFTYSVEQADDHTNHALNHPYYIHDLVGSVIEKVLEYGGDVEFVDNDLLTDYGHIALIKYY
jgi:hypothetical protein